MGGERQKTAYKESSKTTTNHPIKKKFASNDIQTGPGWRHRRTQKEEPRWKRSIRENDGPSKSNKGFGREREKPDEYSQGSAYQKGCANRDVNGRHPRTKGKKRPEVLSSHRGHRDKEKIRLFLLNPLEEGKRSGKIGVQLKTKGKIGQINRITYEVEAQGTKTEQHKLHGKDSRRQKKEKTPSPD